VGRAQQGGVAGEPRRLHTERLPARPVALLEGQAVSGYRSWYRSDINDFDEMTLPGPWEWDVKRLAASFAIAGRDAHSAFRRTGQPRVSNDVVVEPALTASLLSTPGHPS
jgi:Uncharacterized protein conserved in bacteria (DUF2252)